MQVNILEAKNQLSRLVKAAAAGEEVIIASNGTPMVRLLPATARAERLVLLTADAALLAQGGADVIKSD